MAEITLPTVRQSTRARISAPALLNGLALSAILLLSAGLQLFQLNKEGWANGYYSATVRSMLENWHNYFFASFDPAGFVTVDKPPVGFWIQALGAKLFGYSGVSLLLPEAVATIASVALMYVLIRKAFGSLAGLVAALVLALTPVTVVTGRNNTIDSLLVLTLLIAAWAFWRAVEPGRRHFFWLVTGMVVVGIGFNIKMLQAYLPLPAFGLLYLLAAPMAWWKRIVHLAAASAVLLVVSFSWAVAVDLAPADSRPFIGSSTNNTVMELIFDHNGMARLIHGWGMFGRGINQQDDGAGQANADRPNDGVPGGQNTPPAGIPVQPPTDGGPNQAAPGGPGQGGPGGGPGQEAGSPSVFRLFNTQIAGQISWLLVLAFIGLAVAAWHARPILRGERRFSFPNPDAARGVVLWGGWLVVIAAFFSYANMFHLYYLVMLAPGIAALSGAAIGYLWQCYRESSGSGWWLGWLLPVALLATAASEIFILRDYADWSQRLAPEIGGLTLITAIALVVVRFVPVVRRSWLVGVITAVGLAVLLAAPGVWAGVTVANASSGGLPHAGPQAGRNGQVEPMQANGQPSLAQDAGRRPNQPRPGADGQFGGQPPQGQQPGVQNPQPQGGPAGPPNGPGGQVNSGLISFLVANQGSATYLVAVPSANAGSQFIIQTGKPVMAIGGFSGDDTIVTLDEVKQMVRDGIVRYFLPQGGPGGGPGGQQGGNSAIFQWVTSACSAVPASAYQSAAGGQRATLYDCARAQ